MPQTPVRRQRHREDRAEIVPMPAPRDSWESALVAFLADCRRRNLSASTLENYQWWLAGPRLTEYRKQSDVRTPGDMTADRVREFESNLVDVGMRASSVGTAHRHLKNFLGFCLREGLGGTEQALRLPGPKMPQAEPETFTPAEERRLLAALKDRPRDAMLFEFMLRTGVRLRELCAVTVDDIVLDDPRGAFVRVRQGKGRKDRAIPLDTGRDRFSARLGRYVERVRPQGAQYRELFLTLRRDGSGAAGPLSPGAVQALFKRLSAETGVHVHPHKFRHTFATRSLSAGVDIMALQKVLGHTTLAMVSRYIHYSKGDVLDAWRARKD